MENKKSKIFNLLLLDESGSMSSIHHQTISAFNEIMQTMQNLEKDLQGQSQFVSMHTFRNQELNTIHDLAKVAAVKPLNEKNFRPNGNTPLFDAIGKSATMLEKQIRAAASIEGPSFTYQVLVTILTDGMENASSMYSKADIRALVDRLQAGNWTFTYIGADHDVLRQSHDIGIKDTYEFSKDEIGLKMMLEKEKNARMQFNQEVFNFNQKPRAAFFKDEPETTDSNPKNQANTTSNDDEKSFIKRILGR